MILGQCRWRTTILCCCQSQSQTIKNNTSHRWSKSIRTKLQSPSPFRRFSTQTSTSMSRMGCLFVESKNLEINNSFPKHSALISRSKTLTAIVLFFMSMSECSSEANVQPMMRGENVPIKHKIYVMNKQIRK